MCTEKLTASQLNLPHRTRNRKIGKKLIQKPICLQTRNDVEKVLTKEQSIRWEIFVKKVGF